MLNLCESFFQFLNTEKINYCHWKSNSHLSKALNGGTDLDLLVEEKSRAGFESALKKYDFKKILSDPAKSFPHMEDYLGLDFESGKLIHLHVHYRLILGQRYIKNHHLPLENLIFENLTTRLGVKIPSPEIELILLVIRANFKLGMDSTLKHVIASFTGKSFTPYPADIEREFKELIALSKSENLKLNLQKMNLPLSDPVVLNFIDRMASGRLSFYDVLKTRREIIGKLKPFRRKRGGGIVLQYWLLLIRNIPLVRKVIKGRKKTLPGKGLVFSIVGADGSGKSTLVRDLTSWLSWKLDVKRVYLGIPKTFRVRCWTFIIRICKKLGMNSLATMLRARLWIYIARVRGAILRNSRAEAGRGKTVITDRFPLKEFFRMKEPMDGPRLGSLKEGRFKNLAKREEEIYDGFEKPDHVFALQANLNELRDRKNDLEISVHRLKADAVNSLKKSSLLSPVNANRPYPEVLREIKIKIWGLI